MSAQFGEMARKLRGARDSAPARDLGLVVARVALAWIFIYHGASTLFGSAGGAGIHGEAVYFSTVAHLHPATFFAVLAGCIEFFGGIGVGVGVLGRLAAAALVGDMIMAMITVTFAQGLVGNASGMGYQLNLALAALAAVIVLMGTGRFSLDALARSRWTTRREALGRGR